MGLRCLFGHDFGPPGVVREHEEDGNEMVITEREIQRCTRCGQEQVIAESTEVRAIMSEDDIDRDASSRRLLSPEETTGVDAEASAGMDVDVDHPATAASGSAESSGSAGTGQASGASAADAGGDDAAESNTSLIERAEAGFDDADDPAEEDAVILDETESKPARQHGEWPDNGDVGHPTERDASTTAAADVDTDPEATPAADGSGDTGNDDADAEPRSLAETAAEEDAELLGGVADGGEPADEAADAASPEPTAPDDSDAAENGSWPDHDGADDEGFAAGEATAGGPSMAYGNELAPSTSSNGESQGGDGYETSYMDTPTEERDGDGTIVSAESAVDGNPPAGVETEFYCPNCDHTRPLDSSLRSGDICPSCQSGYIAERAR
jgi:hypothetical protein